MAATFKVAESAAKKLFKELGKNVKSASPAKLAKALGALPGEVEEMDEDDLEGLSKASTKLLTTLAKAIEKEQKIVVEQAEADEEEEEEESPKKGKGKKGAKKKASGKASENGEFSKKTQQGHAINKTLTNAGGPLTIEEVVKKASKTVDMSEGRAQAHVDYLVEKEKAKKLKGGKYAWVG